jgi:hypothetical protein
MRTKRVRRGSTLVMVGVMLVAFVGVGAIAADIGRFYVVTSEVQTAADAAAIEGARRLMYAPGNTALDDTVDADVIPWVAANQRANMTALSVTAADVQLFYYAPGTGGNQGKIEDPKGRRPNAVRVALQSTPRGFFAQLLGNTGTRLLKRSATAWVASLGSNCVRPWAFPYQALYGKVAGVPNPAPSLAPDTLDPVQFSNFMGKPSSARMFTILGENVLNSMSPLLPNSGEWTGFNFTGNAGKKGYTDGLLACDPGAPDPQWYQNKINPDAGAGTTLPGNSGNYVNWTTPAMTYGTGKKGSTTGMCNFLDPVNTADCYSPSTSTLGITINSAWGQIDPPGCNGSKCMNFNYVGEFVLLCYYSSKSDTCSRNEPGTPNTGYPEGTIVGYIQGIKSRMITLDDVLGNFASDIKTIVLVQ